MKTNMKRAASISLFLILGMTALLQGGTFPYNDPRMAKGIEITFAEFKCQEKEISAKPSKKILFMAHSDNTKYLFRKDGITFQVFKQDLPIENGADKNQLKIKKSSGIQQVDIYWVGMNKEVDIYGAEAMHAKSMKHLNANTSSDCQIKNFRKLYYTEIYPGIDLRYNDHDNRLKYDLRVNPGFDYCDIKMRVEGVNSLYLNTDGQLIMKTNAGEILEEAPMVLQDGKPLFAKWILHDKTISIEIKNHDPRKELTIQSSILINNVSELRM